MSARAPAPRVGSSAAAGSKGEVENARLPSPESPRNFSLITNDRLEAYIAARRAYHEARAVADRLISWQTRCRADLARLALEAARATWLASDPPARARTRWLR